MFTSALLAAATAVFAGLSTAAPVSDTTSKPALFNLTVTSFNGNKYHNALLGAAHAGAAIEALAVDGYPTSFSFNASKSNSNFGNIVYTLPSTPKPYPEPLQFFKNQSSNVDAAFFGIGSGPQLFSFANGELFHVDDAAQQVQSAYFYVCPVDFEGYNYETLAFVAQGSKPTNAACDQVTVLKVAA